MSLLQNFGFCASACCFITVGSARAASQNGFFSHKKLSLNKKTDIIQNMTKILH
jgi:hypothetical protein